MSKLEWLTGLRGADLTHAEFRVLVALFTYTDANLRNAYPSKATLAAAANVTPRTLTLALRTLQEKGFARIVQAGGNQHRKGAANVWELLPHNPPKGVAQQPPSEGAKDVTDRPPSSDEGGQSVPVKGVGEYRARGSLIDSPSGHESDQESEESRVEDPGPGEPSAVPPPRRCPNHLNDPNPPNCYSCGNARHAHEAWQSEHVRAKLQATSAVTRQRAEARARAIAACVICDDDGYRLGRPCDHDAGRDATNHRGIALVRAALRERSGTA